MKLFLLSFVVIIVYITIVQGQEKGRLCSNVGNPIKPRPIECPHKPNNNCQQFKCTNECDPICVYCKKDNVFKKYASKCKFCQSEQCNKDGAFLVPLAYCRPYSINFKNAISTEEMMEA